MKILQYRPRPPQLSEGDDAGAEPPQDTVASPRTRHLNGSRIKQRKPKTNGHASKDYKSCDPNAEDPYAEADAEELLKRADDILNMDPRRTKDAWKGFSERVSVSILSPSDPDSFWKF